MTTLITEEMEMLKKVISNQKSEIAFLTEQTALFTEQIALLKQQNARLGQMQELMYHQLSFDDPRSATVLHKKHLQELQQFAKEKSE